MYQIIYQNEVIGLADIPVFIKDKDGVWVDCSEEEAEGIAFESNPYIGATIHEIESYKVMNEKTANIELQLTDIEIAQIENEQILTDHDIALLEL